MSGLIYKAENLINGKVYIGQTKQSLTQRKNEHFYSSRKNKTNNFFLNALNRYGKENFKWDVIEKDINLKYLDEKEIYWIKYYDSFKNGYNLTSGGLRAKKPFTKKIIGFNINTKEKLNFDSIVEAADFLEVFEQDICNNCRSIITSVKNFIFFYEKDYTPELLESKLNSYRNRKKHRNSSVILINPLTNQQFKFKNSKEVSNYFNTSSASISKTLSKKAYSFKGLVALYEEEISEELIKELKEKYFNSYHVKKLLQNLKATTKVLDKLKIVN